MLWLLRASMTTTTTMLRMPTACVLRFTHLQNGVSFPVFDKLLVRNYLDLRTEDMRMKGLTILPFLFFKRRNKLDLSATDFFCGMSLKKRSSYFYPHIRSLRLLERFSSKKISSLAVEFAFSPTKRKVSLSYTPQKSYFVGNKISTLLNL